MTRYLISFNDGDMTFPQEDFVAVGEAAHAVMADAIKSGIWVTGAGLNSYFPKVAHADGSVTEGPLQESEVRLGGFCILNVPSEQDALAWAQRFAVACRCSQQVQVLMDDPLQDELMQSLKP